MTVLNTLVKAVMEGLEDEAAVAARQVLEEGVALKQVIEALTTGMREVGEQFARREIFLPGLMFAARAMEAAMAVLEPEIQKSGAATGKKGSVVIGTVEGDMHAIGKNIVIALLGTLGFEVHDLGINVNALDFVKKAQEVNADIIGASSLMTTTMPNMKDLIEILKEKGIRDQYHVILGGAPVTQEYVDECGADSWGENASSSVEILDRVMKESSK